MRIPLICLLALSSLISFQAHAESLEHKIHFSAQASEYFNNDRVSITFNGFAQESTPQEAATNINIQMQNAYRVLKLSPDIKLETGSYQIHPVYKNKKVIGWRGQQTLTLNMENRPDLVKILAKVQPYLRYQNMTFGVSTDLKQKFLEELTLKAIENYRNKAKLIAQGFGSGQYKIIDTHISNNNTDHRPRLYSERSLMAASDSIGSAPVVQAGQSRLTVSINGTLVIE